MKKIEVGKKEKNCKAVAIEAEIEGNEGASSGDTREYYGPGRGKLSTKKYPKIEHAYVAKLNEGNREREVTGEAGKVQGSTLGEICISYLLLHNKLLQHSVY